MSLTFRASPSPSPTSPPADSTLNTSSSSNGHHFGLIKPKFVAFCGIQLEIKDEAPAFESEDIDFNRGKSLEDVFKSLAIDPLKEPAEKKSRCVRARGRRAVGDIRVETFRIAEKMAELNRKSNSKEATPALSKSTSSKSGSKEATPSSANETSKESTPASTADEKIIKFVSGNPFVEVTKGVIHMYKENQVTSLDDGVIRSQMLCMLGVPPKIKSQDLLSLAAPCYETLEMMRIVGDGSPHNAYMVLLRFSSQEAADEFYKAFNGVPFNSFEPDVVSLVYVSKVETSRESEYYPLAGHTELPVCSICLERMDESISSLLTILCNHTFHSGCLAQWEDATCPVCRYVQTPEEVAEQKCSECQSTEDLWICLICGYVGCGRYVGGHSHAHFVETSHCYTMELGQNRVWDYVGDNFVHRLVQTDSGDGKMVEAQGRGGLASGLGRHPDPGVEGKGGNTGGGYYYSFQDDDSSAEKIDSIQLEYTYLLTSQLEAQRRFYEEKISRMEDRATAEMDEAIGRTRAGEEERMRLEERLGLAEKEKAKMEAKVGQFGVKMKTLTAQLNEERQMNESLRKNQGEWQKKLAECQTQIKDLKETKDSEISELKEQMRDLMFYLEAQQTIAQSPMANDIKDGEVVMVDKDQLPGGASSTPKASGGAKKKRR